MAGCLFRVSLFDFRFSSSSGQAGLPDRQAGFSLPELAVVLAILMLLFTLAVPRTRGAKKRAEEAAAAATMRSVHTAQETHRITHGEYSTNFQVLVGEAGAPVVPPGAESQQGGGQSVMVAHGYIFRLERPVRDEYILSAEPVEDRDTRPRFTLTHLGTLITTAPGGGPVEGGGGTAPPEEKK